MTSRVGDRGQITIEKAIREELGIYAGDETVQRVEDGRIVIEVVPGRHRRSLAGSLRDKARRTPQDESWDALRDAAGRTPDPDRRRDRPRHFRRRPLPRRDAGRPGSERRRLIDDARIELGVSPVALAECAHVLRTQYEVDQRDIIDSLIAFVQRENIRVVGLRTDVLVGMLVGRAGCPGRPIPDAMIVAAIVAGGAIPLATFDRDQARYGVAIRDP